MKFRILVVVVVVAGMFVGGCGGRVWTTRNKSIPIERGWVLTNWQSALNIDTLPSGCKIYINDTYVGVSPLNFSKDIFINMTLIQRGVEVRKILHDSWHNADHDKGLVSRGYDRKLFATIKYPPTIKIEAFRDGYKRASKVIRITADDPQIKLFLRNGEKLIGTTVSDSRFPYVQYVYRDVLIALDPIPGHVTTTAWKDTGVVNLDGKDSFKLESLEVVVTHDHSARVYGKIVSATRYVSVEQEREKIYTDGSGQVRETKFVRRKVSYVPEIVTLDNPFGPNLTMPVSEDGSFKGVLQIRNDFFFVKPDKKAYRIIEKRSGLVTGVWDSDDSDGIVRSENYPFPDVFVVGPDYDAVYKYALSLVCDVKLEMKDKVTRRDVTPEITITAVSAPTVKGIMDMFLKEFGSDGLGDELSDEALSFLVKRGFLLKGQRMREDAQTISFVGYIGGEYCVETVHGEYYYFKGSIKPKTTEAISNTVLLVETGSKVRTRQVKESEGGSMVGSD